MTIVESIKCVLQQNNDGLTSKQIYDEIIRQGLYSFGAENPVGVVNAQLRRRCIGLDFPTAYPIKFFEIAGYEGKKIKFRLISTENTATIITAPKTTDISELLPEEKIKAALQEHLQNIRQQVFDSVLNNSPEFFEHLVVDLLLKMGYGYDKNSGIVRWDDNNLKMLLYDLSRSSKFLGNIILTIKSDHTCEIIDGQQRTTVLMLIVSCIKKKFGTKISTPDLCPLRNEGFTGFQTLLEKAFDQEAITSDDWNAILKSDDYHQLPRIQKLWNTISSSELLADRHKAQGLLDNLCKSEFNIIASYSNDVNTSIQYFLDVNLKGIRLDTEDIFKGYLFSQDSRELTRSLWQKNKRDVLRLNGVTQSSEEKRYPLMKLYEHFFYCDLYLPREGDCEYSTLKFGENFCLTSGFESGSTKYYEGSHLIEAIRDRDYLQNVLSRLNKCVEIMTDIIESEGPSTPFKDKFICAKKVDSIDIQNCHSMLKKILMEKEVIPKILALKYILTYFDGKPHAKEEYKSVYSVFCAAVLFTVFANKKESDTFYNFVRLEEWKSKINKWLYDYISSHALTRGKVLAAYKYSESDDDPIQQIRCKSLAAISNFFKVTKNGDNYNMGISNAAELCKFFGDKTVYSLEHFIVGECGTLHVKTAKYDFPYKYPPTIQKYRNSLFNFIFIPQPLNSSLSNEGLFIKVAEIHTHENEIKCSYSKGYYGLLNKSPRMYFQRYPTEKEIDSFSTEEDARAYLNEYFTKTFPEEFLQFSTALVKKINWGS